MPADDLAAAVAALARDGLAVYPPETYSGLGARARAPEAVARAAALKGRDAGKPIALVAGDAGMLALVVASVPAPAERLMARFWPGPLTLVLPARPDLPPALTAGSGLVGIRVSSHPLARALSSGVGEPITATSANPGSAAPPRELAAARAYFGARVDAYVDGGTLAGGPASTVVVVAGDAARVVRAGAIPIEALREALGRTPIEPPG
jgi:L-threonylcarbamoyladenylate synthase